ncbi:MAG: hypothetical protein EHM64_14060 [Ignavibacteriae bacterium]|nr:MAG: hypothetical protein EHM64_14060 [Ignavibacteriota bacterium]
MTDIPFGPIVTLILFPAVYTPLAAPREIRAVILKRKQWIITALIPIFMSFIFLFLAMFYVTRNTSFSEQIWYGLILILLLIDLSVAIVMSYLFNTYDGLVQQLELEIFSSLKKSGKLNKKSVSDLLELGIKTDSWQIRNLILSSMTRIVEKTCSHAEYRGESLEALLLRLVEVFDADSSGNLQNFSMPADMIRSIIFISKDRELEVRDDIQDSVRSLGGLSQIVIKKAESQPRKVDEIVFRYIDVLDMTATLHLGSLNQVSQVLFEIGIQAISNNLTHIGFIVANKLNMLISRDSLPQKIDKSLIASYSLGIISHLWSDNLSLRAELTKKVDAIIPYTNCPIGEAVDRSMFFFMNIMGFETADKLLAMKVDLLKSKERTHKKK